MDAICHVEVRGYERFIIYFCLKNEHFFENTSYFVISDMIWKGELLLLIITVPTIFGK